jgi:hypothetical protein
MHYVYLNDAIGFCTMASEIGKDFAEMNGKGFICCDTKFLSRFGNGTVAVEFYGLEGDDNAIAFFEKMFEVDLSWFKNFDKEVKYTSSQPDNAHRVSEKHHEATTRFGELLWSPDNKHWFYCWTPVYAGHKRVINGETELHFRTYSVRKTEDRNIVLLRRKK